MDQETHTQKRPTRRLVWRLILLVLLILGFLLVLGWFLGQGDYLEFAYDGFD